MDELSLELSKTFLVGMFVAILGILIYPPWIGRASFGRFGLEHDYAPVWNPPQPGGPITANDRWPWQSASAPRSIELEVQVIILEVTVAALILGFVFGGLHHFLVRSSDAVLQAAWSLSLFLLPLVPFGFIPNLFRTRIAYFTIGLFGLSGIGHGLWSFGNARQLADRGQTFTTRMPHRGTANLSPAKSRARVGVRPGSGLLWFVSAIPLSIGIAVDAVFIAQQYRGPIAGYGEWHMPIYAQDQRPLFAKTGIAVAGIGWALAMVCFCLQKFCTSLRSWGLRHAGWGLIVGTTLIGIAVATLCR